MSTQWICPDQVFDGQRLHQDIGIRISNGIVADLGPVPEGAVQQRLRGTVTPGFVDLQVNGGGGVLVNQSPDPAGLIAIAAAHRTFGTVAILPTIITDAPDVMHKAAEAAIETCGTGGIVGLHIEGPHIATARRGTHAERFVRPVDDATIALVTRLRDAGVPVMLTLAPEAASDAQIKDLAATGAVVSLGHTDATSEQAKTALTAGATCFTHLFNAMSPMLNRAPGVVGAAINSNAYAGIICDGIHVADEMVGLAIRARPAADRMFLVSDAMPTVGGPDYFNLYGMYITLRDGRLINTEGSLAGAHVTQAEGVTRLVTHIGLTLEHALRMAITVPATLMSLPNLAMLKGRDCNDVLILDEDLSVADTLATLDQPAYSA